MKFEISLVPKSIERPHGLRYSFTLHQPSGQRFMGIDNAHGIDSGPYKRRVQYDHIHRHPDDPGRPYHFETPEKLIDDFQNDVNRILTEYGAA